MNVKRMMFAVAVMMMSWAGTASAQTEQVAYGAICDTAARVDSTHYYTCVSGGHTAVDMSNGSCSEWNHRGMIQGSVYYAYYGGCANNCTGGTTCNSGAGNHYKVVGMSGWDFWQLHLNSSASSFSKTCDRCALGLVGATGNVTRPHVHSHNRRDGVRTSAWYTKAGTTCGSSAYCGHIVGYPTL